MIYCFLKEVIYRRFTKKTSIENWQLSNVMYADCDANAIVNQCFVMLK